MIEGIIHNNLDSANDLNTRVHTRINAKKKNFKYKATSFFSIIKHPTQEKWLTIINRNERSPIMKEVILELTTEEMDEIEMIGEDWFPQNDI